ncbi:MAG: hypothetical protein KDA87_08700 [Planctomycetales bacterium]|nr:hypothetical protein [Planctomycetales bacterium]
MVRWIDWQTILRIGVILVCGANGFAAEPIRIDLGKADGRNDTSTRSWFDWKVSNDVGTEVTAGFGPVQCRLRAADADASLMPFMTKAGIDTGATMATDGVECVGGMEVEIRGLAPGWHSLVTFHNSIRNEPPEAIELSSATSAAVKDDDSNRTKILPSHQAIHNDDVASGFIRFHVEDQTPVVFRLVPGDQSQNRKVILNGLICDGVDPRRLARKPYPAPDQQHAHGDSGDVELRWTPAPQVIRHHIYFATDVDVEKCAARVLAATPDDAEFLHHSEQATALVDVVDNDSLRWYVWRVDEEFADGSVEKGDVWRFRIRHLAFPGAEGYGRHAKGGRGGRVIAVTNLNDAGPGSLRAAVESEGARTVVFHVSGLISLESKLVIRTANSNLTVAGQTAPGKGICVRNWTFGALGANDVIIRHIRLRLGDLAGTTMDGMGLASADHAILDHCSISWTIDEAFSSRGAQNITLQRCLISEALNAANHKKYGSSARHSYAASIGGDIGSFHHNLLAHCAGRNWSLAGGIDQSSRHKGRLDVRNNVVYNWHNRTTDGGAFQVNFVNNYYKPGPASKIMTYLNPQFENPAFGPQQYYVAGNVVEGINGPEGPNGPFAGMQVRGQQDAAVTVDSPFFEHYVTTHSAEEAYDNVLSDVGCNVPALDEHDRRVIQEVRSGTTLFQGSVTGLPGIPDSQTDVGGWEEYPEQHRPADWDTDGDGMPNAWEMDHDLDPANASDGSIDPDGDGFTNLEDYLNELTAGHLESQNQ